MTEVGKLVKSLLELIMLAATLTFLYQNIEKMVSPIVMYTQPETHQLHARDIRGGLRTAMPGA